MTELPPAARARLLADARELAGVEGELLFGRYRLVRELGRGGMGVVYEAEDTALGRRVALKRLAFASALGPGLSEAVLREARAAARLDHAHIAAVYDAYPDALVLQLVLGPSLAEIERPPLRELVGWIRDAARAVQHAHEHGLVHRDLKPHNLLVADGRVFVTDFGLAKELASPGSHSLSGSVLGTPSYMPPEQASGLAREVDARSDVYALGATLYDKLAGRPPFVASDVVALLRAVVEGEAPPLAAHVPRDLARVVGKCLEKDKERRYASAAALADDLENWLAGRPVVARAASVGYRLAKWTRRHRALVGAGALVLVVALAGLAWNLATRRAFAVTSEALELAGELELLSENAAFAGIEEVPASAAAARESGLERCREFLARHPEAGVIRTQLAELLVELGRRAEARGEFERVLAVEPGNARTKLGLGLVLAQLEGMRRAS
ncbi:MAG: protein kinase, partial [Planctomycetota bacterium]